MQVPSWERVARFTTPWCFVAIYIFSLMLATPRYVELIGLFGAYFFPPLGKESVIPLAIASGYNPLLVALGIAAIDSIVALFLVWNWSLTLKIPLIGQWIDRATNRGARVLARRPWIRRLAFLGLALFVVIPFQGSGGVGGAVIGRIMGMKWYKVWAAVTIGAISGSLLIAYLSDSLFESLKIGGPYVFAVILTVGVAVAIARHLRETPADPDQPDQLD